MERKEGIIDRLYQLNTWTVNVLWLQFIKQMRMQHL